MRVRPENLRASGVPTSPGRRAQARPIRCRDNAASVGSIPPSRSDADLPWPGSPAVSQIDDTGVRDRLGEAVSEQAGIQSRRWSPLPS